MRRSYQDIFKVGGGGDKQQGEAPVVHLAFVGRCLKRIDGHGECALKEGGPDDK